MKKLFTFAVALLMMSLSANAGTIVGNEDNTSTWWSAFSDYYTMKGNGTETIKFTNYTDEVANWDNWVLVVTTDADRSADGYSEYFVIRSDHYGWGTYYSSGTLTSNFDWDTFKSEMSGASVVLTLTRADETITLNADITAKDGTTRYENFVVSISGLPETIRCFLTVEAGHLDIESAEFVSATNGITTVSASSSAVNAPAYNLAGQKVGNAAKGVVIKNGKKYVK